MEPIAPGTEDEPLMVSFSTSTKQEKERERLLTLKAVLPSGKYDHVFTFKYINGTEHWYCNACSCPVMGWVFHHESGKRHTMALGNNQNPERFTTLSEVEETPTIQIAPGEPVPPGFEGQIEKIALIQERLDVFNVGPLVALEYLLELRDYDPSKEPAYLCLLCDKKGDPRTVLTHLASYKHILQYLQKHFPTCYRALAPYMTKQYKRNWQIALHEIAEAIEKRFGRLKPMPVDADKYEKDPVQYIELIAKGRHFSELSGYTFENLVNKEELTRIHEDEPADKYAYNKANLPPSAQRKKSPSPPVVVNPIKKIRSSGPPATAAAGSRRRSLSSVSSITSSDLSDFDEPKEKKVKPPVRRSKSPLTIRNKSPYGRRPPRRSPPRKEPHFRRDDRERERERDRERDRSLMPWEKPNYRRPKSDGPSSQEKNSKEKNAKIEEYKKLCKAIDNDMDRILKNHRKNPEKHAQYNDEWKKFWNKRYKELQAEAKDVSTHDFKPEWIEFWNKRMIELHQEEVKVKKEALRRRLGLPEEPSPICFKIGGKKKFDSTKSGSPAGNKPIPPSAMPDNDPEVIVIDDRDDDKASGKRRSHSPWEEEPAARSSSRVSREKSKSRDRARSPPSKRSRSPPSKRSRSPPPRRYSRSPRDRSRERSWDRDYKIKDYRRERIRIVSELPWERERERKYRNEIPSYYKPPPVMRDVTREPVLSPRAAASKVVEEEEDADINVVSVLRLLTALEEKLGSLGPKVIDLLTQALGMEKNEANSSENLLDNEINCVMFETVKEKLKGQLLAGLVEPIQEKAFKNCIKKTASLIHMAGERKKEKEKSEKINPVKVPGVGTVDKAAIARQIANALVLQGKTDVTQAELEQLINAVVGMAEASRNSDKPITTANFLEQITKAGEAASAAVVTAAAAPPPPKEIKTPVKEAPVVAEDTKSSVSTPSKDMECLLDSDLQMLLQNFKDLSTQEQHNLINYLKKLEASEPNRVERLRKFVNLGGKPVEEKKVEEKKSGRESPFANRTGSVNPSVEEKKKFEAEKEKERKQSEETVIKLPIDSDEEDYTFEDLVKAASKNVKEKEREIKAAKKEKEELNMDDTRAIISNIMNNINKVEQSTAHQSNLLGFGSSADFAKTLNSIPVNMANLANIVGSVQGLTNPKVPISAAPMEQQTFGGYPQPPQFPMQTYQPRPANPNTSYGVSYPPYQQQTRPNVAYPIDKTKVTYPNYALYGQVNQQQNDQQRRTNPQGYPPPSNQFGNNSNRNNYNNRW